MNNHATGTYVAYEITEDSKHELDNFVTTTLKLDNPVDPAYYHTTVIYSTTPVPEAEYVPRTLTASASFNRYAIFETKRGTRCLTVLVKCPQAVELNKVLTELGATSQFTPYCPHLTLSYDYKGTIEDLPELPFTINYDRVLVKPLDTDFVPPPK